MDYVKGGSLNSVQKDILVQFIKNHLELQTGRFTKEFTFKKGQTLWEEVTDTLNSVPNGVQKSWRQWRKTWQDIKKHTKSKAAAVKKHASGTGGGEPLKPLSDMDSEVLDIMSPTQIDGINIPEAPINFAFNKENEIEDLSVAEETILENQQMENTQDQLSTNKTVNVSDHQYANSSLADCPRKMNKTTRLRNSLNISTKLLKTVEVRNSLLEEYYTQKTQYLKKKSLYLEKKLDMEEKMLSTLSSIENIIKSEYIKK